MSWSYPIDWPVEPKWQHMAVPESILKAMLFNGGKQWKSWRLPWFRKCNASGKWIWPMQKAWLGVVTTTQKFTHESMFTRVWLTKDQYVIQKLKGNI